MTVIIKQLVKGAISGYVLRGIQFITSILIVPFLIDETVLGLKGYGQIFSLLALFFLLSLFTDGIKLSQSRAIARSIETSGKSGEVIGSGFKIVFLMAMPLVLFLVAFPYPILELFGLPTTGEVVASFRVLVLVFLFENSLFSLESCFHALRRSDFVNIVLGADVILRNLLIFICFTYIEASIFIYFVLLAVGSIGKNIAYLIHIRRLQSSLLKGFLRSSIMSGWPMLRYSFAITGQSLSSFLIYRGSILVANKFMGTEAAGLISLVIGTIRNYLLQILFGVLRPMVVPLTSRLKMEMLSQEARQFIHHGIRIYTVGVFLLCFSLVACAPKLLEFWLGTKYILAATSVQLILFSSALDLSSTLKNSILVAQGYAKKLYVYNLPLALFCFAGILVTAVLGMSWKVLVLWVTIYGFLSGGMIMEWIFYKSFPALANNTVREIALRTVAAIIIFIGTFFLSSINIYIGNSYLQLVFAMFFAILVVLGISHYLIISMKVSLRFVELFSKSLK